MRPPETLRIRIFFCSIAAQGALFARLNFSHIEVVIFKKRKPFAVRRLTARPDLFRFFFGAGFLNAVLIYDGISCFLGGNKYDQVFPSLSITSHTWPG